MRFMLPLVKALCFTCSFQKVSCNLCLIPKALRSVCLDVRAVSFTCSFVTALCSLVSLLLEGFKNLNIESMLFFRLRSFMLIHRASCIDRESERAICLHCHYMLCFFFARPCGAGDERSYRSITCSRKFSRELSASH